MRNLLYIAILSISLGSCGGGGSDPTPPPVVNTAPTVPTLALPVNNSLCTDNVLNFTWNASTDAEGGVITYEIQVAKNTSFSPVSHTQTSPTTSKSITLEKGIAYYWRVKATDSKNASSNYSSTFSLYTEGVGITNHLPFSPVLVGPALNSVQTTVTVNLQWSANDVDAGDTLTYEVYFGTVNPPTAIVSANQSASSLSRPVTASTKYYWKVTVKDNKGGQTVCQIWSFTTD
jgi:hypothetical protein